MYEYEDKTIPAEEFDVNQAVPAQREYCHTHGIALAAPITGVCGNCNQNIYIPQNKESTFFLSDVIVKFTTGITLEKARTKLVTSCPHCHQSFIQMGEEA
jgi:protein-arginine kinase activator protein McsA